MPEQPSAAGEDVVHGLLTLAGVDVALPLSALREVVPRPAELTALPVQAPGLLGVMSLRALVLPVVDLRPLTGGEAGQPAEQVVVVVAHGGRTLGLVADAVRGVCRVAAGALLPMSVAGGRLLFSHAFRHPDTGTPVSVLDPAELLALPGVPTVADVRYAPGSSGVPGTAGRSLTLVRCGARTLALDVEHVHTILPLARVRASVLDGSLCRGVTEHAGVEVPVADPLVLLGLGRLADAEVRAGVVLDHGRGHVVLAVSELLELREVSAADVLPVPRHALARPDLVAGMADLGGPCLVLDGPALLADPELRSLAAVNTSLGGAPAGGTAAGTGTPGSQVPYLSYSAGGDLATPLDQVAEILPFPTSLTPTALDGAVLGVVLHRRAVVPVVCLATVLGREPAATTPATSLLLVEVDGEHVAFAVAALRGIDPLAWADRDRPRGAPVDDLVRAVQGSPLVQLGTQTRLLPDLDLREVARAVRGPGLVAPCPEALVG